MVGEIKEYEPIKRWIFEAVARRHLQPFEQRPRVRSEDRSTCSRGGRPSHSGCGKRVPRDGIKERTFAAPGSPGESDHCMRGPVPQPRCGIAGRRLCPFTQFRREAVGVDRDDLVQRVKALAQAVS